MLVRSVIYGVGFDFMHPFQKITAALIQVAVIFFLWYNQIKGADGMTNLSEKLYLKIKSIMDTWCEEGIYAVSFFVNSNEAYEYRGFSNVSSFAISYNTEDDCEGADQYSEERWNYAFWRQDETLIIDPYEPNELTDLLFDWYKEHGILNIGEEDEDCYDEDYNFIGKGPAGHYELLTLVSEVAKRIQQRISSEKSCPSLFMDLSMHGMILKPLKTLTLTERRMFFWKR